jgi:hypothetical protein
LIEYRPVEEIIENLIVAEDKAKKVDVELKLILKRMGY